MPLRQNKLRIRRWLTSLQWALLLSFVTSQTAHRVSAADATIVYRAPKRLCVLENKAISESSGLAVSRRDPNLFWTHNDSGDKARLFCFDQQGRHRGTCRLKKAKAVDWEDMCSFMEGTKPKLLVADIGDNIARRKQCELYVLPEPIDPGDDVSKYSKITVRYADGPVDCEAIGVDIQSRKILFVTKVLPSFRNGLKSYVLEADLPDTSLARSTTVARPIGKVTLPVVTGMDVSPDGKRAIVITLGQAFEFVRRNQEPWKKTFARKPRKINMPPRRQGEAICYGANGRDLFLTSEQTPAPFLRSLPRNSISPRNTAKSRLHRSRNSA